MKITARFEPLETGIFALLMDFQIKIWYTSI